MSNVRIKVPSVVFHIFIVSSSLPLAKKPFVKTANVYKYESCPVNILFKLPSVVFHIFIVLSLNAVPLARKPLGNAANERTQT